MCAARRRQRPTHPHTTRAAHGADPNIKVRLSAVLNKDVVLLFSMDDTANLFDQLSVLLFLQRILVPRPLAAYAAGKWKQTVADGEYDIGAAASITVVVPWYRYCQMERTCRWTVREGKWYNGAPTGEFVDIPTATSFAALLSATPAESTTPIPKQLLFLDIHECTSRRPHSLQPRPRRRSATSRVIAPRARARRRRPAARARCDARLGERECRV